MVIDDKQIIQKYKISKRSKILDVGGAMKQHEKIKIDTLVDIISPEEAPYRPDKLKAKHFVRLDITRNKLPFKDNEFDFCLCTHTLEDLPHPFLIIEEMSRVAKRGLIVTPSFGADVVFSHIDETNWMTGARRTPGNAHHKYLFYKEDGVLKILPKNYPLLYSPKFQVTGWSGEPELVFYWEKEIKYEEFKDLDFHALIDEYTKYFEANRKFLKLGKTLQYLDNPYHFFKERVKLFLKRGVGFRHSR